MKNGFQTVNQPNKKISILYTLNLHLGINFSLLSAAFCLLNFSLLISKVQAQIVPDSTLPVNSIVTTSNNINNIEGGTQAGGNLFHSFQQFSVPTGSEAFFNNGIDIQNIFTRVTGNSISEIDGLIRANGTANLFLLNPNGIIFGTNAKLNIGGSFLASTANSFRFSDGTEFNARNPQASPLLTVNVPVGLQYGGNAGEIQVKGQGQNFASTRIESSFAENLNPLSVKAGNTLALVGGNIIIDGGILQAPGGRVELGGLAGEGTVGINIDNNTIASLSFPDGIERADISITNKAGVNTIASGGGSITINARNIDMLKQSLLATGIQRESEIIDAQAGDIALNATGSIVLNDSRIDNIIHANATGNSGNITINGKSLLFVNKTNLINSIFGEGTGGIISVDASENVTVDNSTFFSTVEPEGTGNSGAIVIKASSILVNNNSELQALTRGEGDAGIISIDATDTVSFDNKSSAFSTVEPGAVGDAIGIKISTNSLLLKNGSALQSLVRGANTEKGLAAGQGNSGAIILNAKNISLTDDAQLSTDNLGSGLSGTITLNGSNQVYLENSSITSTSSNENTEDYGDITITAEAGSIFLNNTELNTTNDGSGFAGDIILNARDLISISNGSEISSEGNSGIISLGVRETTNSEGGTYSPLEVKIDTSELNTTNSGSGYAGNITINARDLISIGNKSEISSEGNQGNISIGNSENSQGEMYSPREVRIVNSNLTTNNKVTTSDPNQQADNTGFGVSGNIEISGTERVDLENSSITSTSSYEILGENDFSDITIAAAEGSIFLDNSKLNTNNSGAGYAGDIRLSARDLISIINGSTISSQGNLGRIFIGEKISIDENSATVQIENSKLSTTNSRLEENAGSIEIYARDGISISNESEISSDGKVGNISIGIVDSEPTLTRVVSLDNVLLTTNNEAVKNNENVEIDAGSISISAIDRISLVNGSQLQAYTSRLGNGGTITIQAENGIISLDNSNIFGTVEDGGIGNGGNIIIRSQSLSLIGSQVQTLIRSNEADPTGERVAGNITIEASEEISFSGLYNPDTNELQTSSGILSDVAENASGNAGNIKISAPYINLNNQSAISAESTSGKGGNISLELEDTLLLRGESNISTSAGTEGKGGDGGNITITTKNLVALENSNIIANAFKGQGGVVKIDTKGIFGVRTLTSEDVKNLASGIDINEAVIKIILTSDITAISQLGDPQLQGTVTINTPDVDPSAGLIELPPTVVDATKLAASSCRRSDEEQKNQFIVTGRGGLPPNPNEALSDEATWMDLRATGGERQIRSTVPSPQSSVTNPQIREAQGWKVNDRGQVELLAQTSTATPQATGLTALHCPPP